MANNYDFMFKFIIVGDSSVGKSCLLLRFTEGRFKCDHQPTLGVEFGSRNVSIGNLTIKIQIWDTAGQESFKSITRSYYKSSIAAFLVFDLTKRDTFDSLSKWLFEVKNNSHERIQVVVVGNKSDLKEGYEVSSEEGRKFAQTHGFEYYQTSASTGANVEEVFTKIASKVAQLIESNQISPQSQSVLRHKARHPPKIQILPAERKVICTHQRQHRSATVAEEGLLQVRVICVLLSYNRMSIYSGFPTRKDQTSYNQLLARILQLLQAHLLEVIPAEKLPNAKVVAYARVLTKMQQFEEHKYLPPKFSQLLQPLASLIGMPSKIQHQPSCYESPQLKTFSSNSPSNLSATKDKHLVTFKMKQSEGFTETQVRSRKQSKGEDSMVKKRERKFHGSFYDIQERKIKDLHERYQQRVQEVNERVNADQDLTRLNYRSQTQSPAEAYKSLKNSKYDPADKYGIVHMRALKQAQDQLRQLKSSTPKPHRQHT